ncbi:hypothetical protein ABZT02_41365 [Streptomyces sp. NPDC005402]|uniref:hypothetical protein n=1 Tax=Streptomyces sp. NPDC005402 TaxID=3155338 RepID=UPI0033B31DD7
MRNALGVIAREEGLRDHLEIIGGDTMRLISACSKLARIAALKETLCSHDCQ